MYNIILELEETNSRLAKESILTDNKHSELLQRIFYLTLNPRINFFQKTLKESESDPHASISLITALDFLENDIAKRHITGNAAIAATQDIASKLSSYDREIFKRVIERDMDCGVNVSTVNKIWKGLIPEVPYQRCSLYKGAKTETWDWSQGVFSQMKADGSFAYVIKQGTEVTVMSRNGKVYPKGSFKDLEESISSTKTNGDIVLQGELIVFGGTTLLPREIGNGKLNSIAQGKGELAAGEVVKFMAWDVTSYDEFAAGVSKVPYSSRFAKLATIPGIEIIESVMVYSPKEAMDHYKNLVADGYEGTIIKKPSGVWKDGTSKEQVKLKVECDIELKMCELNEGNGKNKATFGSIRCESSDGSFVVNVSGFTDEERLNIFNNWDKYVGGITTVRINNIMKPEGKPYSAFLPRFIEHRTDKTEADSIVKIIDQFDSVIK